MLSIKINICIQYLLHIILSFVVLHDCVVCYIS